MLVYDGCFKKLTQIQWLKATTNLFSYSSGCQKSEISVMRLESADQKIGSFCKVKRSSPFLAVSSFWTLSLFLGSWWCIHCLFLPSFHSHVAFFCGEISLYLFSYKNTCDYIGPTHIIQDNFPISKILNVSHLCSSFYP